MHGHYMNPSVGRHMAPDASSTDEPEAGEHTTDKTKHPHVHIHSHSKGHTVHIFHHDGTHEKHEHDHGDHEGIAEHLSRHFGGGSEAHGASAGAGKNVEY